MRRLITLVIVVFSAFQSEAQSFQLAVLKYNGGGDYYANPTSVPNLIKFCNRELGTQISSDVPYVEAGSPDLIQYPFIHMTGHGNVVFSLAEAENLRNYMLGGGFLHIDDNYGMDEFIRVEIKKIFPNNELIELPSDHALFKQAYSMNGLPKIHEHDDKRAQAFAIIDNGRIVCLYTYECDLGDGWEDPEVHGDSAAKHQEALRMGANILSYVFLN